MYGLNSEWELKPQEPRMILKLVLCLQNGNGNTRASTAPMHSRGPELDSWQKARTREELTHPCLGIEKHLLALSHDLSVSCLP